MIWILFIYLLFLTVTNIGLAVAGKSDKTARHRFVRVVFVLLESGLTVFVFRLAVTS